MAVSSIATEMAQYMREHGAKFNDWYVGITSDMNQLVRTRRIPPAAHLIARDVSDPDLADDIQVYLYSFGCDGAALQPTASSTYVYAFLKRVAN